MNFNVLNCACDSYGLLFSSEFIYQITLEKVLKHKTLNLNQPLVSRHIIRAFPLSLFHSLQENDNRSWISE